MLFRPTEGILETYQTSRSEKEKLIPTMVRLENDFVSDLDAVLDRRCDHFEDLYNPDSDQNHFDKNFFQNFIGEKIRLQAEMSQPNYVSNPVLNDEISYHEIELVLQNVKKKKKTTKNNWS